MEPTKEELDEAIKYFTKCYEQAPMNVDRVALSILTKYRDGELVDKAELANSYSAGLMAERILWKSEIEKNLKSALNMQAFAEESGDYTGTLIWGKLAEVAKLIQETLPTN